MNLSVRKSEFCTDWLLGVKSCQSHFVAGAWRAVNGTLWIQWYTVKFLIHTAVKRTRNLANYYWRPWIHQNKIILSNLLSICGKHILHCLFNESGAFRVFCIYWMWILQCVFLLCAPKGIRVFRKFKFSFAGLCNYLCICGRLCQY